METVGMLVVALVTELSLRTAVLGPRRVGLGALEVPVGLTLGILSLVSVGKASNTLSRASSKRFAVSSDIMVATSLVVINRRDLIFDKSKHTYKQSQESRLRSVSALTT